MEALYQVLGELETAAIEWSEARTARPSPMAQDMSWRQINEYMYMGDEPSAGTPSGLHEDLLKDLVRISDLRPTLNRDLVEQFQMKRQRLSPGYTPGDAVELLDWIKERVLIPYPEWEQLLNGIQRDHDQDPA